VADLWVFQKPVLNPVEHVAGSQHRLMEQGILFLGNVGSGVLASCFGDPDAADHKMRPEIGWRAGDDAVVVAGEALRLFESLFAPRRAPVPIGMFGSISVIGSDDGLGFDGHLMDRSIPEINHLFGMAQREAGVSRTAVVPGICGGGRIAAPKRHSNEGIQDCSQPTAIANAHELAIPARRGHPYFELDTGIFCGPDFSGDAAERGQVVQSGPRQVQRLR